MAMMKEGQWDKLQEKKGQAGTDKETNKFRSKIQAGPWI
jgi:hypothetical protein